MMVCNPPLSLFDFTGSHRERLMRRVQNTGGQRESSARRGDVTCAHHPLPPWLTLGLSSAPRWGGPTAPAFFPDPTPRQTPEQGSLRSPTAPA